MASEPMTTSERGCDLHSLVLRQLRKSFPGEPPATPEMRTFIEMVNSAYRTADDDRAQLERSLDIASEELYEQNRALQSKVAELTLLEQRLDRRRRDMALILDNVAQGFVTVGLDGSISNECSQAMTRWFGTPAEGARIWTHLASHNPNLEGWMQFGFDDLTRNFMPQDVTLAQLPRRLDRDGRQFHIEYQPIGTPLTAVLLVVSDITAELARQRAEEAQRELIAVIEHAYRDRSGFLAFMNDASGLVRQLDSGECDLEELKRHVHTLKGNAALFGVVSVSKVCHDLETQIDADGTAPSPAAWEVLETAWRKFHDRVDQLLGISQRRSILVDWDEYQAVLSLIVHPEPAWAPRLRRWGQDATRPHLERFANQARQLAERLGKAELDVEIRDYDLRIEPERFGPVWSALVHAVRNAVDHGIESAEARVAAGKSARARMALTTELVGENVLIEVEDDGGGIDWEAVAARAKDFGLPSATTRDLEEALFASGLSTAREITQTSGRGVGMSALRATCLELGGRIEVLSHRGHGTILRCVVPAHAPIPFAAAVARTHRGLTLNPIRGA
jgi:two-component system, chemotaxis family, sensor kinase CheA